MKIKNRDIMIQKSQEIILFKLLNDTINAQLKMREFRNKFENNDGFQGYYTNLKEFDRNDYIKGY
jgi:hypothetical protein